MPLESEPPRLLERAGFVGMRLVKFDAQPCFVRDGATLREMQLEGLQPAAADGAGQTVLYKGPFRQVTDGTGTVYQRGERVRTSADNVQRLRSGGVAEAFLFLT